MRGVRAYTTVDDTPVDVRKEGVDVLSSLSGRIVEEERMLPDIHDEDRLNPATVPCSCKVTQWLLRCPVDGS